MEGQGAVFLTTRVDMVREALPPSCIPPDGQISRQAIANSQRPECYRWGQTANASWYISQIEDYLVKIDHAMLACATLHSPPPYAC